MTTKNFVVKNGLTTGSITLDATSGNISGANASLTGNLSVTGKSNLGAVANVTITGGSSGYILSTDGAGNLSFADPAATQSPAPMPTYVAVGDTLTITANYQGIFGYPITVDGTIVVDGILVDVNDATIPAGNINYVQYNAGNVMGGDANFYYTAVNGTMTVQNSSVIGNSTIGNLTTSYTANLGSVSNVKITGGVNGYVLQTDGVGNLSWTAQTGSGGSGSPGGANTQVQFNDAGLFGGNSGFTFNKTTGVLNVTGNIIGGNLTTGGVVSATGNITGAYILGNGSQLSGITATTATTAGTVTTAAQPNITSTGTLSSVSVSGNANIGNIGTAGLITATGNLNAGNLITAGVMSATGNATAGNLITSGLLSTTGNANIGNAINVIGNVTGTGSINSFGDLVSNATFNINATRSLNLNGNSAVMRIARTTTTGNPAVELLGLDPTTGAVLDWWDFYTGSDTFNLRRRTGGAANLLITASSTGVNFPTGDVSATGNVTSANILTAGNVTASRLVSNIATGTAPLTVSSTTRVANLNVDYANVADFINVTAPGTGTAYIIGANATTGNIAEYTSSGISMNLSNNAVTATTFIGALSGAATSATTAGTVTTNAQPNITSTGTLTSATVSGNITAQANINMTGYVIRSVSTGISAAGSTQGTATAITKEINVVSTVASGAGVILPTAVAGMAITITNTSANSLLVYPATNGIINSLSANAAYTQASGSTLQFVAPTTTQWYTIGASYA